MTVKNYSDSAIVLLLLQIYFSIEIFRFFNFKSEKQQYPKKKEKSLIFPDFPAKNKEEAGSKN
jgi:hypothetical protein